MPARLTPATASAPATPAGETAAVFGRGAMSGLAYMALAIASLIPLKVGERTVSARGRWAGVAVARVIAVVHMAVEATPAVKPRPSPDE